MRIFIALALTLIGLHAFGQSSFDAIARKVQVATLPYSTAQNENRTYDERKVILHLEDSAFIVSELAGLLPITASPFGETSFGMMDCADTADCLHLGELEHIAILCMIQCPNGYLLHVELDEKGSFTPARGLLMSISSGGKIGDWVFSNGSANSGNPHGNIRRDFTISVDGFIQIREVSWGDNTEEYAFDATYEVMQVNGTLKLKAFVADD